MHKSDSAEWCYISGRVCVLETSLLKRDFFERLIRLEKNEEVFLSLGDSPLKDLFIHIEHLYEFDRILEERYINEIHDIRGSSPDPLPGDIFLVKYDFLNLKNFLKELLAGIPREAPSVVNIMDSEWKRHWEDKSTELAAIYKDAIDTIKELKANSGDLPSTKQVDQTPLVIDLVLDNAYLCHLADMISKLDAPLINEYFETYFLIKRTEIILRAIANECDMEQMSDLFLTDLKQRDFFLRLAKCPHEGWQEALLEVFPAELVDEIFAGPSKYLFTRFERLTENHLLDKLYPARFVVSGPERVFGYLCGFTIETYNLRLALGGKVNGINTELLQERLREPYV